MERYRIVEGNVQFAPIDVLKKNDDYVETKKQCRFCEIADICHLRESKEKYEATMTAHCPYTAPIDKSERKRRSKKRKAARANELS